VNSRAAEFADRIEGAGESSAEGTGRGSRSAGGDRDPAAAPALGGPSVAPDSPSCRPRRSGTGTPLLQDSRSARSWTASAKPHAPTSTDGWSCRAGGAVATTFPLLHAPRARSRAWGAFTADGRLAAHVAACRMEVRTDDRAEPVSMSFVGTVACDPVHRGRGLATAVLARALADEAHAGLLVVPCSGTDRPELYARLGFAPVGAEFDLQLDRPSLAAAGIAARRSGTTRPAPPRRPFLPSSPCTRASRVESSAQPKTGSSRSTAAPSTAACASTQQATSSPTRSAARAATSKAGGTRSAAGTRRCSRSCPPSLRPRTRTPGRFAVAFAFITATNSSSRSAASPSTARSAPPRSREP
jgi:GNAT superfamily N-acetyltransferase